MQIVKAPTNHQLKWVQQKKKIDMVICWQIGKTFCKAKTSLDDFVVATPKNPLINNPEVTSIRNLSTTLAYPKIQTYSWTFAPILNWTWSCNSLLSLYAQISNLWQTIWMDPRTWLTPVTWTYVVGCKVLYFISNEDHEALGYKTL